MEGINQFQPAEGSGSRLAQAPEFGLRDHLHRLWRYKWLLLSIVALTVGPTWIALQQTTPRYTATALMLIEPPEKNVVDLEAVVKGLDTDSETVHGELLVLRSRGLAEKAVAELDLQNSLRLDAPAKPASFFSHLNPVNYLPEASQEDLAKIWDEAKISILGQQSPVVLPEEEQSKRREEAIVSKFLGGVSVKSVVGTRAVEISFTSEDPKFAARAANTLVDVYVHNTLDVKFAGTKEATAWLNDRLAELREKVAQSEEAVERLRQGEALVEGRGAQLSAAQISAINEQLIIAQAETARLRAQLRQMEKVRKSQNGTGSTSEVLSSPLIQDLKLKQFVLEQKAAELSNKYGDKHPKMINIRAEIANIESNFDKEIDKIAASVRSEVSVAQAREASLRANLERLTNEVGTMSEAEMKLRAAEREAKANRLLFETFLSRYKETSIQEEFQQPDARVISYAEVPGAPSYPEIRKTLTSSLVLALGLGLALVYLVEALDKGFRKASQLEEATGLPTLSLVPRVDLGKGRKQQPADLLQSEPNSRYTESIKRLYASVKWQSEETPAKSVLVTSALAKEGKTTVAVSIARRAAMFGEEVIFVDCDLRHPQAARTIGLKSGPGLAELIRKEATLDEVLQKDEVSGASFLASGYGIADPVSLVQSDEMRKVLAQLGERFSFIVIDSSPVLAVTEPRLLGRMVDRTLFTVRWGKTPREVALAGLKDLEDFGVPVEGLVLSQVDLRKQAQYGYGEYGYYSSRMEEYYKS